MNYSPAPPATSAGLHRLRAPESAAGRRLDQALALLLPEHSRTRLRSWIEAGLVRIDGAVVTSPRHKLVGGETLTVEEGSTGAHIEAPAQDIGIDVVFEDDALIVVDKPAGLVVHPGSGNPDGTLLNALLHYAPELAGLPRAGIVHRIDKDTSGLLVVARTAQAQTDLVRQLAARTVSREYLAVVHGNVERNMTVDAPIGRHPTQRTSMAVVERGKPARTHVEVVERLQGATLVRCRLETGRTHQIRVHLAAAGHPLVGDPTYRGRGVRGAGGVAAARAFPRQALHARRLGLVHPASGRPMQWESPVPEDIANLVASLRAHV